MLEDGGSITIGTLAMAGAGVLIGIGHVAGTASLPLMAAQSSDVVTTFEVVQVAAIDLGTLG